MRPVSRLRLVLPAARKAAALAQARGPSSTAELLAAHLADALAVLGIQVRQQLAADATPHPDGAPRADVALWLPDDLGMPCAPDTRHAPARTHIGLVIQPGARLLDLGLFDAVLVPHGDLVAPLQKLLGKSAVRDVPVSAVRLPGVPSRSRDGEKAARGVGGRPVVAIDVRGAWFAELERIAVQLGLLSQGASIVLVVPHDERARARVRTVAEHSGLDLWISSGADAFADAVVAADLVITEARWDDVMWCAFHQTCMLAWPSGERSGLSGALVGRTLDELPSVLQLAASIDRRVTDLGALRARGLALHEVLCGPERAFLDALAAVEPLPTHSTSWERVGPYGGASTRASATAAPRVDARDPNETDPHDAPRAQRIEDALAALKQKIAQGG